MMGIKILVVFILALIGVSADDALQELQQGNLEFSSLLYQHLPEDIPGNHILSPLSVQIVLALCELGAKGETATELSKGLHLPDTPEKTKEAFKALIPKLKGNKYYSLSSANKIYIKNGYTINPDFLKLGKDIFATELESIDFSESVKAANTINKWVESKTNGKIRNLIASNALSAVTRLLLINALYFKGNWSLPFPTYRTSKRVFYQAGGEEIAVDTMFRTGRYKISENNELDAKFIEIPYRGCDVTFNIALPNKIDGLNVLEKNLLQVLKPQNYSTQTVDLFLPKFQIDSSFRLIPALQKLGIRKAFDSNEADFSGFLVEKIPLFITDILQKAFINVTESGTEAAAATAVGVSTTAVILPDYEFRVDRPFFYSIKYKNFPIFLGRVVKP